MPLVYGDDKVHLRAVKIDFGNKFSAANGHGGFRGKHSKGIGIFFNDCTAHRAHNAGGQLYNEGRFHIIAIAKIFDNQGRFWPESRGGAVFKGKNRSGIISEDGVGFINGIALLKGDAFSIALGINFTCALGDDGCFCLAHGCILFILVSCK